MKVNPAHLGALLLTLSSGSALAANNATCTLPGSGAIPLRPTHIIPPAIEHRSSRGKAAFAVSLGADGTPSEVDVRKSSGSEVLDEEVRGYVRKVWRWTPPSTNCQPPFGKLNISFVWGKQPTLKPANVLASTILVPDYPSDVLLQNEQGMAQIELLVTGEGEILSSRWTRRSGFTLLDELSMQLVTNRDWSAQLEGKPSPTLIPVQVEWKRLP